MSTVIPEPDVNNAWRTETPGSTDWPRSPHAGAANKYFMVSADGHVQEPSKLWAERMPAKYRDRLPGVTVNPKGEQFQKTEGFRPLRLRNLKFEGEDALRNGSGKTPEERLADLAADGVDCEILFPNKGLTIWATPDAQFSQLMCRVFNDLGPGKHSGPTTIAWHRWAASQLQTSRGLSPRFNGSPNSDSRGCACPANRCGAHPITRR